MTLLPMLWLISSLEGSIFGEVSNDTSEVRDSATLIERRALRERLGYLLSTKVCRAQVHDASKERKLESIDFYENYIVEEMMEQARKTIENDHCASCSRALIIVLRIMVHK